jgi:hypothetical protein
MYPGHPHQRAGGPAAWASEACRLYGAGRRADRGAGLHAAGGVGCVVVVRVWTCEVGGIPDLGEAMLRRRFSSNMVGLEAGA